MAKEITDLSELKKEPYLDLYDSTKGYERVMFNPDRPLLQSELNSIQSMQENTTKELGNSIMADGDIISGMDWHINGKVLTVDDGKVYIDGKVRTFNQQNITINGTGDEYLSVYVKREIITADDDPDLLDKTSGVASSFSKGGDRLKETVLLGLNTDNGAQIFHFQNGDLFVNPDKPNYTQMEKVLANRTMETSGNFRVSGYNFSTDTDPSNANKIQLAIDKGVAYILGFRVEKPATTRISVDKAQETKDVQNEGYYYDNVTRKMKLGNAPVKSVNRVTGQVEVTKESVSRGVKSGGVDYLRNTSVTQIKRVWSDTQEYRQGTDYQLVDAQGISWEPTAGLEPASGGTYYVQYVYNKSMVKDTDYKITTTGEKDGKVWYIDFNGLSGSKPVNNSLVNIDYTFYLARKDLIVLDHNGKITIHKGEPDRMRLVEAPNHVDPLTLSLGTITLFPNSDTAYANLYTITRMTMEDLQKTAKRVDNIEYNQAVNALDDGAMEGENPVTLRGVFSDGFISFDKYDATNEEATVAFDFDTASITLPYKEINKKVPKVLQGSSTAHIWGRLVTAPFTEEVALRQPFATEPKNVNPYNTYNKQGVMTLTPSEDNWIDEENITVTDQKTSTMKVKRWWRHQGASWTEDEINSVSNITLDDGQKWGNMQNGVGDSYRYDTKYGRTGTMLESGGQRTKESMIEFMRQIDVTVYVENLTPNANNLKLTFDGLTVPVTPLTGWKKGSATGTGMANADGTFKGTFKIPAGVRCGTREVTLENDSDKAIAPFIAQGTLKTVEDVIIRTRVTVQLYDPLAQTFSFNTNRIVSSIDVYFASKDPSNNVICQIRGVSDGGMPNKTIYAETVLKPANVSVSNDASAPTKVTFDDPLMCEAGKEYAMVFVTDSSQYSMWIGTMGQNLVNDPGQTVTSNPYLDGVLFSSSNASAWTVHQTSDLKFTVYTAKFNETALAEFDTIKNIKVDQLVLMSSYLTPANTGCTWEMKLVLDNEAENVTVDSKPWEPISNYVELDVEQIAREVKLRASFKSNIYISPMLSLSDVLLTGFITALSGSYISRAIDMTEAPFNTIWMSYESFEPTGSKVTPQYSLDEGKTWKNFTVSAEVQQQSTDFNRYVFEEKVATGTATYKTIKYRLNLSSSSSFLRPRARRFLTRVTDK